MEQMVLPILLTALFSVSGSYFVFTRRALTKTEHALICKTQAQMTTVRIEALQSTVDELNKNMKMLIAHLLQGG